jgi:hypothetical protein
MEIFVCLSYWQHLPYRLLLLTLIKEDDMKNRRISITSSIIEGIERMVQSNCIDESYAEFILDWIQNIKRFPMQKYSDLCFAKELLEKLSILKTQYIDSNEEKNGLVYHKSVLDAFMYITKVNEKYGEVAPIAVEVEKE